MGWKMQQHKDHLPLNIINFLCTQLNMNFEEVTLYWNALESEILQKEEHELQPLMPSPFMSPGSVDTLISFKLRK